MYFFMYLCVIARWQNRSLFVKLRVVRVAVVAARSLAAVDADVDQPVVVHCIRERHACFMIVAITANLKPQTSKLSTSLLLGGRRRLHAIDFGRGGGITTLAVSRL